MASNPILKPDGRVSFASAQAFRDHHASFLSQGAALVVCERALSAFARLELLLDVPGAGPVRVQGEVTSLNGDEALIRLDPFDAQVHAALGQAAEAARDPAPPPAEVPAAPESPLPAWDAPPPAPPPTLNQDGEVVFAGAEGFREHYVAFLSQGAALLQTERALAPFEVLELSLAVPGAGPLRVRGEFTSRMGASALFRLQGFDIDLQEALRSAAEATRDPAPAPAASASPLHARPAGLGASVSARPAPNLPARGEFLNPALPQDFLTLPIGRAPTPEQLQRPPVVLLLSWLFGRKSDVVALRIRSEGGHREAEVTVSQGEAVLSVLPIDAALRVFAEARGTYETTTLGAEPKARYQTSSSAFGQSLLKECTKRFIEPEYAAAMSGRHGQSPRLTGRGRGLIRSLSLSDTQARVASRMFTGQYSLDEALNSGVGVRSTWQTIVLLNVLGGLEWVDPPPRQNVLIDELRATLARIKLQDHFSALGLHLTSSPKTIERTYLRLRSMYAPGSHAHRLSPQTAEAIWAHMERCYAVIGNPAGRRSYRAQAFPDTRLSYAATLVYDQARLAELRKEFDFALDLMESVLELHPSAEFLAEYRRIQAAARDA